MHAGAGADTDRRDTDRRDTDRRDTDRRDTDRRDTDRRTTQAERAAAPGRVAVYGGHGAGCPVRAAQ